MGDGRAIGGVGHCIQEVNKSALSMVTR